MSDRKEQFTEGPWDYSSGCFNSFKTDYQIGSVGNHEWYICAIEGDLGANGNVEGTANANLIAAAPELYEALEAGIEYAKSGSNFATEESCIRYMEEALKKARGEK